MTEETCANCGQLKEQHPYFHEYRDECKKFKAKLVMDDESRVIEEKPQNHSPQREISDISSPRTPEGTQNHTRQDKPLSLSVAKECKRSGNVSRELNDKTAEKSLSEKKKKWRHVFVEGRQHTIYCVYGEKDVKEAVKRLKKGNETQLSSLLTSILLWFLSDNIKIDEERLKRMFKGYLRSGFINKIMGDNLI